MRDHADTLTIAYVAMGARTTLEDESPNATRMDPDDWDGDMGFIGAAIEPAVFLDRVADYFDEREGHPGVWLYEVAEPFGEAFARALLLEKLWAGEPNVIDPPDANPARILREVMVNAGYDESAVDAALKHADALGETHAAS